MSETLNSIQPELVKTISQAKTATDRLDNSSAIQILRAALKKSGPDAIDSTIASAHAELARAMGTNAVYIAHGPPSLEAKSYGQETAHHFDTALEYFLTQNMLNEAVKVARIPVNGFYLSKRSIAMIEALMDRIPPDSVDRCALLIRQAQITSEERLDERLKLLEQAERIARNLNDPVWIARSVAFKASALDLEAKRDEAVTVAREVVDTQQVHRDELALGIAGGALYIASHQSGDLRSAIRYATWMVSAGRAAGHSWNTVNGLRFMAQAKVGLGQIEEAIADFEEANSISASKSYTHFGWLLTKFLSKSEFGYIDRAWSDFTELIQSNGHMSVPATVPAIITVAGLFRRLRPERMSTVWSFCEQTLHPDTPLSGPMTAVNSRRDAIRAVQALIVHLTDDSLRADRYLQEFRTRPDSGYIQGSTDLGACVSSRHLQALLAISAGDSGLARTIFQHAIDSALSNRRIGDYLVTSLSFSRFKKSEGEQAISRHIDQDIALALETGFKAVADGLSELVAGGDQEFGITRRLTGREREVLRLLTLGYTNDQIASELEIGAYTVAEHLTNVYSKTGSENRAEAAVFAVRSGIA